MTFQNKAEVKSDSSCSGSTGSACLKGGCEGGPLRNPGTTYGTAADVNSQLCIDVVAAAQDVRLGSCYIA